jgi:hypothetical protein
MRAENSFKWISTCAINFFKSTFPFCFVIRDRDEN